MISILLVVLTYLKICTCLIPTVYFDLQENSITKFPWMVAITNELSLVAYGTFIHKKAVLTRAVLESNDSISIEKLRVYADCFFLGEEAFDSNYNCSKVRQVSEYNVIEEYPDDYEKNLAILILTNSFKLSDRINVIQLAKHADDIYTGNCGILSLKTVENTQFHTRFTRFFSLLFVEIINQTSIQPVVPLQSFEGILSYNTDSESVEEKYIGSPLVCQSILPNNSGYMLVGVVNGVMKAIGQSWRLIGDVIRTDGDNVNIQQVLQEIIRISYIPKKMLK